MKLNKEVERQQKELSNQKQQITEMKELLQHSVTSRPVEHRMGRQGILLFTTPITMADPRYLC